MNAVEAWETLAATHAGPSHYRNRAAVVRRQAAGSLLCKFFCLVDVLRLTRMLSHICTMIVAVRRQRLKLDIDGENVLERPGETGRQN